MKKVSQFQDGTVSVPLSTERIQTDNKAERIQIENKVSDSDLLTKKVQASTKEGS